MGHRPLPSRGARGAPMLLQGEEQSHNWRKGQHGVDPGDSNVTLATAFPPFPSPPAELSPPWHGSPSPTTGQPMASTAGPALPLPYLAPRTDARAGLVPPSPSLHPQDRRVVPSPRTCGSRTSALHEEPKPHKATRRCREARGIPSAPTSEVNAAREAKGGSGEGKATA